MPTKKLATITALLALGLATGCATSSSGSKTPRKAAAGPRAPAWAVGKSRCLGFEKDGSAAFVLLEAMTGDNLAISASYWVAKVDFASKKASKVLVIAEESDCQSQCDDEQKKDAAASEVEPAARARKQLAAAAAKINALITKESLVACAKASEKEGDEAAKVYALDGGAVVHTVRKGKAADDADGEPARTVVLTIGKKSAQKLFVIPADDGREIQKITAVYYLPKAGRAIVVVTNEAGGATEAAYPATFSR